MKISPEPEPVTVTVAGLLKLYTVLPTRTLQGVVEEQPEPMVTVPLESDVLKSPSWDANEAPVPEPVPPPVPLPPLPASKLHTFAAVHAYRLTPAAAAELKNNWPTWQVEGSAVPTVIGRVNGYDEKSGFLT